MDYFSEFSNIILKSVDVIDELIKKIIFLKNENEIIKRQNEILLFEKNMLYDKLYNKN